MIRALSCSISGLRSRARTFGLTNVIAVLLVMGVALLAVPAIRTPTFDLDSSWAFGISSAVASGLQFGPDILFTYGPWAPLDLTTTLSFRGLLLHNVFWVLSGTAVVVTLWILIRRWSDPTLAAIMTTAVAVPAIAVQSGFSDRVLLLSVMLVLGLAASAIPARWRLWVLVALAAVASLAIQVKFSNGVLALATVVLGAALLPDRSLLVRARECGAVFAVALLTTCSAWLIAGQSIANLPAWIRGSIELTSGYGEAMATENAGGPGQYIVFAGLATTLVILAARRRDGLSRWPLLALVLWAIVVGLRLGFTRHDLGHAAQTFVLAVVALAAIGIARAAWLTAIGIVLSAAMVFGSWGVAAYETVDPGRWSRRLFDSTAALVSASQRAGTLESGYSGIRSAVALDPTVQDALVNRRVHVDPVDANVALAYYMDWTPVPVLQSYSAYTPYLDRLNAEALRSSTGPNAVLRRAGVAIDGRNPLWDSPEYMFELLCGFETAAESGTWAALLRTEDRCGGEFSLGSALPFAAGETIAIPDAADGYAVFAHVSLNQGVLDSFLDRAFKVPNPLTVTAGGEAFRLPRALASGPLIVHLPDTAGWGAAFGGLTHYPTLAFSESGTIEFVAVRVR